MISKTRGSGDVDDVDEELVVLLIASLQAADCTFILLAELSTTQSHFVVAKVEKVTAHKRSIKWK